MSDEDGTTFALLTMAIHALKPFEEFANLLDGPVPAGGSPLYAVEDECRAAREALNFIRDALHGKVGTGEGKDLDVARDLSGAVYVSTWIRAMGRELGIAISEDNSDVVSMSHQIIPALNDGTAVGWGVVVNDKKFAQEAIDRLQQMVNEALPA